MMVVCNWQFDDTEGVHHSSGVRLQVVQLVQQESSRQSTVADTWRHLIPRTERLNTTTSDDWQATIIVLFDDIVYRDICVFTCINAATGRNNMKKIIDYGSMTAEPIWQTRQQSYHFWLRYGS